MSHGSCELVFQVEQVSLMVAESQSRFLVEAAVSGHRHHFPWAQPHLRVNVYVCTCVCMYKHMCVHVQVCVHVW